jgi:parallel beta-helix repeat protein
LNPGQLEAGSNLRRFSKWHPAYILMQGLSSPTPGRSRRAKPARRPQLEALEQRLTLSTYYVATTGSDNNPGTQSSPFATLQHAMMSLQAGATLDVEPGKYTGFIVGWDSTPATISGDPYGYIDGTASAPITIQAAPGSAAGSVIIDSRDNKTPCGIDLEPGDNYININGLTITDGDGSISLYGIKVAQSNYVNITNNIVYGVGATGIYTSFSSDGTIANNVSYDNGEHGFYAANSPQNVQILNNVSYGNANGGIQVNADASQGGPGTAQNLVIADNVIYNNGTTGGGALNFDGLQNSLVYNNLLYDNHSSGIVLYDGDASEGSIDNIVVDNTVVQAAGAREALNNNTNSYGNVFYDNIFLGNMLVDSTSTPAAFANNVLLSGYSNDGDYTFPTSILSTPSALFADPSANNYQELSTSPSIGAGTATDAPSTDLLGNPRPGGKGYDIGSYQYEGGGGVTAALVSNSNASASSAALQSTAQSYHQDAAVASLVNDSPISILPDSLLNTLVSDLPRTKQRKSLGVAPGAAGEGLPGA